ncbi:MAG: hypothetical protein HYV99_10050 [Betaproteobacteria bacterium]|nr:hypothetical protein [Betaproteobacteria bacterium]
MKFPLHTCVMKTPEAGPLEKRVPAAPPGTQVWVVGSGTSDLDVIRNERGEIFLAAGKTLILIDPSEPSLQVEVRARDDEPLYLGSVISLSRQRGIYAGLVAQHGQANAGTAVEGPNGVIVFKAVPASPPRAAVAAARVAPPAIPAATVPGKAAAVELPKTAPDPVPEAAPAATSAAAGAPRGEIDSYASAMRALAGRQGGGGVRSVSELTRVHPAVDLLRGLR